MDDFDLFEYAESETRRAKYAGMHSLFSLLLFIPAEMLYRGSFLLEPSTLTEFIPSLISITALDFFLMVFLSVAIARYQFVSSALKKMTVDAETISRSKLERLSGRIGWINGIQTFSIVLLAIQYFRSADIVDFLYNPIFGGG